MTALTFLVLGIARDSIEPTHFVDGSHSIADHYTYGTMLYQQVMAKNPNARVILFETWSRAAAHAYITGVSGPQSFASTGEMQSELRTNYAGLASALIEMLADPLRLERWGHAGQERVREHFLMFSQLRAWGRLLTELLSGR